MITDSRFNMSIARLNRDLSSLQRDVVIPDIRLDGVWLWHLIKSPLYDCLIAEEGQVSVGTFMEKASRREVLIYSLKRLILSKMKLALGLSIRNGREPMGLFIVHTTSRIEVSGKFVHPFGDIFLNDEVSFLPYVIHNDRGLDPVSFQVRPDLAANPLRQPGRVLRLFMPFLDFRVISVIREFHSAFSRADAHQRLQPLKTRVLSVLLSEKVRRHVGQYLYEYGNSVKFLRKLNPRFVFITVSQSHAGLIRAARESGIATIELQHGLITADHRVYDWNCPSAPSVPLTVPEKLLVWGSYWRDLIISNGSWPEERVVVVGNPKFDLIKSTFNWDPPSTKVIRIVFSSNSFVAKEASAFFLSALNLMVESARDKVELLIKLHPNERDADPYSELITTFPSQVRPVPHSEMNIYQTLSISHFHLSGFSIALFESVGLGIPTMSVDINGSAEVLAFDRNLPIEILKTPTDFADRFNTLCLSPDEYSNLKDRAKHDSTKFFEPKSCENIRNFLNDLCK